jgi:hypothetical protein
MALVPAPRTWSVNDLATGALLNTNIRDALNFLLLPVVAAMRQTVAQSLANNTTTGVNMDTEDVDRDVGHSTSVNTSRYTSQTAGYYVVIGMGSAVGNAAGRVEVGVRVNGTTVYAFAAESNSTTSAPHQCVVAMPFLAVGDYVELTLFQNSGGAINTAVANGNPRMYVLRVSN